jgi:hypothetical protein
MMQILGISGKAQNGKDTTALFLKQKLENLNKKVLIVHYADYLKTICKEWFGWDGNKDEEGRELLQRIGTNIVRNQDPYFWVESVGRTLAMFSEYWDYVLIPDTRFLSEIFYWSKKDIPILIIRVNRIGFESCLTEKQKRHSSETELDSYNFDYIINSEEGLDKLELEVDKLIKFLRV